MTSVAGGRTVVVVGGGITGLAAAYELSTAEPEPRVAAARRRRPPRRQGPGHAVRRAARASSAAPTCSWPGPRRRSSWPATSAWRTTSWRRSACPRSSGRDGRLHQLPPGLVLGAPARLGPMARSRLLSWRGKARAAVEPVLPRWHPAGDEGDTLGLAVRARFGDEVLDRLVGPLIGGINAGDPDHLSLRAVTPQIADALAGHRSLLVGLRAQARAAGAGSSGRAPVSPFLAPRGGVSVLVERLRAAVTASGRRRPHGDAGGRARAPGRPVDGPARLRARDRGRCRGARRPRPGRRQPAGRPQPGRRGRAAHDHRGLRGHGHAGGARRRASPAPSRPVATWCPAPSNARSRPAPGDRRSGPSGGSPARWSCASPPAATGTSGRSSWTTTTCWRRSCPTSTATSGCGASRPPPASPAGGTRCPQYAPGHVERVDALTATLARDVPGLWLAGAAYRGLGLPACIAQGRAAARAALATVGQA